MSIRATSAVRVSLTAIARRCYELQGHSIFEIVDDSVTCGASIVRKGPVHLVETGVRLGIDEAFTNQNSDVEVCLWMSATCIGVSCNASAGQMGKRS